MLKIETKTFTELTTDLLYEILKLRSAVFVVEQNCVYQDLDGKDKKALHVIGIKDEKVVAYTRIFKPGDYFEKASIGRVVVAEKERIHGYGYNMMNASIESVKTYYNETEIQISAQCYLKHFYNKLGFIEYGNDYLEDGIPHIKMHRSS